MAKAPENIFASKEYDLLVWLSKHQTVLMAGPVVMFSQNDIAAEYQCSLGTVNRLMQSLYDVDCVRPGSKKGTYYITNTGQKVITQMQKIERIIKET